MNGTEHFAMTGSSNPRTEQLAWLSEVASAVSKGTLGRQGSEQASSFAPHSVLSGGGRMYVPPFQMERPAAPYYSQAPRNTAYSNFYQATYSSPMAFSSTVITTTAPNLQEAQHSYVQIDNYQPPIGVQTVNSSHSQNFLQLPSSPTHNRIPQGRSILIRSPEESAHLQSSPALAQILDDAPQRKSLDSSPIVETEPCSQRTSPYRMPTGKEGSLKHRILRPPSINILDPPPSVLSDAPLSAPPIRTQSSPKQPRSLPSSGYRSFSSSASSPPPAQLKYPQSFMKGSIIQLANNKLKHVEHMTTEDFLECGLLSPTLRIDSSTVTSIEKTPATGAAKLGFHVGQNKIQITVEAPLEHPFFVYRQGWSSCSPERSAQRYGLSCHKLKVGDTCVSLTDKPQPSVPTQEQDKVVTPAKGEFVGTKRKRRWSAPDNISPAEDDA